MMCIHDCQYVKPETETETRTSNRELQRPCVTCLGWQSVTASRRWTGGGSITGLYYTDSPPHLFLQTSLQ